MPTGPFPILLLLLLVTSVLTVVAARLPWPRPITYVLGGLGLGLVPGFPAVSLDPGFFFLCFLPPLLFADGWLMPLRDFRAAARPILLLSIGLVLFTTLVVGLLAHALIPGLPLSMAFALGAVISPTDAVAVAAITERLRVPARLTTILNGESLMNDATGLVAFKFALAATAAGAFSLTEASVSFLWLVAAGTAIGLGVAIAVGALRDLLARFRAADPHVEVTLSLLTPYAAYLAGQAAGGSAVLAVVAAGLYSGWRDPVRMSVETRRSAWSTWTILLFWLNGTVFVLLGLQFPTLVGGLGYRFSFAELLLYTAIVSATAMLARIIWFFPGAYLPFLFPHVRRSEPLPDWRAVLVGGWAGMRGAVTLAAALSIPFALPDGSPFPARNLVIVLSFGVILATLLLQGTTLEALICRLGVREDDTRRTEDLSARRAAVGAGLLALRQLEPAVTDDAAKAALAHVVAEYEQRVAELAGASETAAAAARRIASERRFRFVALAAERRVVDDLWRRGVINDETHRPLQAALDLEESRLSAAQAPLP